MYASLNTRIVDILGSTAENGEVRVKIGDKQSEKGWGAAQPFWGMDGFFAMPNEPDANGSAMGVALIEGNIKRVIGSRDNRFAERVGTMEPGDRMIVSRGEARFLLKAGNDSLSLYTKNQQGSAGEDSMMVSLSGEDGTVQMINGKCSFTMTKDAIVIAVGGTFFEYSENGIRGMGPSCTLAYGNGSIGVNPGGIPPVPPVNSPLLGPTGLTGIPSTSWVIAA